MTDREAIELTIRQVKALQEELTTIEMVEYEADAVKLAIEAKQCAISALKEREERKKNEPKTPCDLCAYNPPSSFDGKPCAMCTAMPKEE